MKKIVRLTEADLVRIVKRVINEQSQSSNFVEFMKKHNFVETTIEDKDLIQNLIDNEGFDVNLTKYFVNEKYDVKLITDGKNLYYLSAPPGIQTNQIYNFKLQMSVLERL